MANDFIVRAVSALKSGGLYQKALSSTWDPKNGGTTTVEYIDVNPSNVDGTLPIALVAEANNLIAAGWSTNIQKEHGNGPKWTLTGTYPADLITDPNDLRIPTIQWEIDTNEVQQDIFEATDRPFIASLTTQTKAMVENALKYPAATVPVTNDIKQFDNAWTAYSLKVAGVDSRLIFTTTLKRTLVVPTWYNPNWALNYNGKVLSKAFLTANYNIPYWVAAQIPESGGLTTDVNGITTAYGYLEYQPPRKNVGFNRVEVSQQWVYNKWSVGSSGLYDTVG